MSQAYDSHFSKQLEGTPSPIYFIYMEVVIFVSDDRIHAGLL